MYYIDFDNTIYETGKLTKDVLDDFAKIISKKAKISYENALEYLNNSFNSTTDCFETFASKISEKYDIKFDIFKSHLQKIIIENGKKYVFPDALNFLKKLQDINESVCILTYVAKKTNINQQFSKLLGSGILSYVTQVYTTSKYKFELELNYKNGVFIDDSPRDLEGLYNAGAKNIIRIKKPNNLKRTSKNLNIPIDIPTYTSFDDIIV